MTKLAKSAKKTKLFSDQRIFFPPEEIRNAGLLWMKRINYDPKSVTYK